MAERGETPIGPAANGNPHGDARSAWAVFRVFLRLGLTSFGGPIAHLGYFRNEFVARQRWLSEETYADIVSLSQFLPGPASSQVGLAIGMLRAGWPGALAAWLGFMLPSAVVLTLFAYGVHDNRHWHEAAWLHGLRVVAVAVVAQAVWSMGQRLCYEPRRMSIATAAVLLTQAVPTAAGQIGAIVFGAALGAGLLAQDPAPAEAAVSVPIRRRHSLLAFAAFLLLLVGLPILALLTGSHTLQLLDRFYRSGALVFGGGHVILPLLQAQVVPAGWISNDLFLAGYGAAQAVPGPLFTFAAYLGAAMAPPPNGAAGAAICVLAIFLPSFLLVPAALPWWSRLRGVRPMRTAMAGVNAAVVGLLLSALYRPIWTSTILVPADFGLAVLAFVLLAVWKAPPWTVVVLGAVGEVLLQGFS